MHAYLLESGHTDGIGDRGGQGRAWLTGGIGGTSNTRPRWDARVIEEKAAGEFIGIVAMKASIR
jgi:hypothetical protein